jgi:hypothetical protein
LRPERERDVLRILSRLAVGVAVYVVIVLFGTSLPLAAGMMLTFPALNGLAFFFSERASVEPIARTMLWMPLINGALCALYIVLFLALAPVQAPVPLAWGLLGLLVVLWLVIVRRRWVARGVALEHQFVYAVACTLAGLALTVAAIVFLGRPGIGAPAGPLGGSPAAAFILDTIGKNGIKIVLFALCLLAFLLASAARAIPDWIRGILAGLPIIPFGGLVSLSADGAIAVEERLQIFRAMAASVWLSPAVPIWFVWGLARFYGARQPSRTRARDDAVRFLALVLGWLFCFLVILAVSFAVASFW